MPTNPAVFDSPEAPRASVDSSRVEAPIHPASFHSPSTSLAFGPASTNLVALDAALTQLEEAEQLSRRAEAVRIAALAKIDRVARAEAAAEQGVASHLRAAEDTLAYRAARADAATAMHLSEQTVAHHLAQAATLSHSYPSTLAAIDAGAISLRHAVVILDAGHIIDAHGHDDTADVAAKRADYEAQVLAYAATTTPPRLRPIARRIAEAYALEDLDTRHERARKLRTVWVTEREEGMAELGAYLPAHEAYGIYSRITRMAKQAEQVEAQQAREVQELRASLLARASQATATATAAAAADALVSPDTPAALASLGTMGDAATSDASATSEPGLQVPFSPLAPSRPRRSRSEIRSDLVADLLLNGTGDNATGRTDGTTGISGIVQLVTFAEHFEALSPDAASRTHSHPHSHSLPLPEMDGYGPIPVSMAHELAAESDSWSKVSVENGTGNVLSVDNYRPTEAIRRFLSARDQRCRFPGCRVPVHRCDFDHTVDAALGGATSTQNLGALCRGHHVLKHHSGWQVEQLANGDYNWTSPTNRTHIDEPVSRVRFVPVTTLAPDLPESRPQGTALPKPDLVGTAHPF